MAKEQQLSAVLSEFARTMVTDFPIQGILDHLVECIVDILPITGAGVTLISPGVDPRYVAASDESALRFEELQIEAHEGPCLLAYDSGEAVSVADLRADDRFPNFAPRALCAGLAAVFTFPLRRGDHRLGVLDLYRDTPGALSRKTMTVAQTMADMAAAYVLNAQARVDLQDASDRAREALLHDALTGLPNRTLMLNRLRHAFLRGHRSDKTVAVLFIDLDRFKAINEMYGHAVGDELLVAVAERLRALLRPGDTVSRMSGDEFVILCEDVDTPPQALAIGARIDAALTRPFVLSGTKLETSASVGIAFAGREDHDPEQLVHHAEAAMYQAKSTGGACQHVFDRHQQQAAERRSGLERDLQGALGRGELQTEYQAIVNTIDGQMNGFEALLRWMHPTRGLVSPRTVMPLAEQSGVIDEIGGWVLERAWRDRHRWQSHCRGDDFAMSVNVSDHQFMSAGFTATVADVLKTTDTSPTLLTLEVTESVFLSDSERALVVLSDLKNIGVMLALDDFGTGYSSLSYLRRFPVDILKVDRGFVADVGHDSASHNIVGAVVQLAHGLGMTVVAEGVETAEQHKAAAELGCDACQGSYFARPMSAAAVDTLLDHRVGGSNPRLPYSPQPQPDSPWSRW